MRSRGRRSSAASTRWPTRSRSRSVPKGRNVVIDKKFGSPTITKDGVTVAKEIDLKNPLENMGAQMVREVASKTSDTAGDGTTTATVLAQAIFREGIKIVAAGANPMELKRGIEKAVEAIVEQLKKLSKPVQGHMIGQVGTISANSDETIGKIIAEAMEKVGKDGVITVEEAQNMETSLDVVEGMQFDRGYLSPYFVTDPGAHGNGAREPRHPDPREEDQLDEGPPSAARAGGARRQAARDHRRGRRRRSAGDAGRQQAARHAPGAAVKAPGFGDRRKAMLEDIAILTGGKAITEDLASSSRTSSSRTWARRRRSRSTRTTRRSSKARGTQSAIEGRVKQLRTQIEDTTSDYDREKLQERLAKLVGGVAIIKVGAATETEMKEKKARVEDAMHATKAAVEEGIVPGGGVALVRCGKVLDRLKLDGDQKLGIDIVRRAIEAPLRWIASNAGPEGSIVVQKVKDSKDDASFGYNAATDTYEDLVKAGVIDPTKVVRSALQNAASIASLLLTTEAMVAESRKRRRAPAAAGRAAAWAGCTEEPARRVEARGSSPSDTRTARRAHTRRAVNFTAKVVALALGVRHTSPRASRQTAFVGAPTRASHDPRFPGDRASAVSRTPVAAPRSETQRLPSRHPETAHRLDVLLVDSLGLGKCRDGSVHAHLAQKLQHGKRRAVGVVPHVVHRRAGKLIGGMKARDLKHSREPELFDGGIADGEKIVVIEEFGEYLRMDEHRGLHGRWSRLGEDP